MTAILGLTDAPYLSALREVRDVHDDLRREQESLNQAMRLLLLGGWTGPAAQMYGEGWGEWETGCRRVLDALHATAELMAWAASRLHRCDDAQGSSLAVLDQRLGEPA